MSQAEYQQRIKCILEAISAVNKYIIADRHKKLTKYSDNSSVVPDTQPYLDIYKCNNPKLWKEINKNINDLGEKMHTDDKLYLTTCLESMMFLIYTLKIIDENIDKKIKLDNEQNIDINILIDSEERNEILKKCIIDIYNNDAVFINIEETYNRIVYILEKYLNLVEIPIDDDDYLNPVKIKLILIKLSIYIYQELSLDILDLIRKINYTMDVNNHQFGSKSENNKKLIIDKVNELINILNIFTNIINANDNEFSRKKILEGNIILSIKFSLNLLRI